MFKNERLEPRIQRITTPQFESTASPNDALIEMMKGNAYVQNAAAVGWANARDLGYEQTLERDDFFLAISMDHSQHKASENMRKAMSKDLENWDFKVSESISPGLGLNWGDITDALEGALIYRMFAHMRHRFSNKFWENVDQVIDRLAVFGHRVARSGL